MATRQVTTDTIEPRVLLSVLTAVKRGDFSARLPADWTGSAGKVAAALNEVIESNQQLERVLQRLGKRVGKEGQMRRAALGDAGGAWATTLESVNDLIDDLLRPNSEIGRVIGAVARGDLSQTMPMEIDGRRLQGQFLDTAKTVNTMVNQLSLFTSEVTRVAREVGTEGKLGGQAQVKGVGGVWMDLTDNVNLMAGNLTGQVRNIAEVTTAVANGDLSKKITVEVQGEILELKNTVNVMVDQLNAFANEVTRVAREVGTEGKLGGQAEVAGVGGVWKDLTDNVNFMASNLTGQVRNIAEVTTAVAMGDLSKKITVEVQGEILELKNTVNVMVDQLNAFANEVTRVAREVGTEGKLGGQAEVAGVGGVWKDLTDNVNFMASNLTGQVRNIAEVTTAVAMGDLSKKITVDVRGEILELKNTINVMVDQLNAFAREVTRVAREVGTEGKLGGQAEVIGVGGIWQDLTDNVNTMASNLTDQVRGIARVVTEVANGDLKGKLVLEAKGEIAELVDTINSMTDTLAIFAEQVTSVAREVGVEGRLGGQASVPGAAGTWRDLTDNVNQLSATLTTQVRAIAEVATAVTEGDLTRSIGVEASGEVAVLKDNINEMILNLKETTQKNMEQDWLKTNLARFTRLLQGQRDLLTVSRMIMSELAPLVDAEQGAFYTMVAPNGSAAHLSFQAGYAYKPSKRAAGEFGLGEGLVGQCALERKRILLTNVPRGYIKISSGLGDATPLNVIILPVLFEGDVRAVLELASFQSFSPVHQDFLSQLTESIGIVLNNIEANARTEGLLKQSQSLTNELQSQQDQLRRTNEELEQKAGQLAKQNAEIEQKRHEVEEAKNLVEEKAEQLALTSRYKSEFLANMSHELRTPLNSLLILAQELADNPDRNLLPKQVEYATIIRSSGTDLLKLINDILDLNKIESGTVAMDISDWPLAELRPLLERTFRHVAEATRLAFTIQLDPDLPSTIPTDPQRLQQVLNNLLSNAFKFTERGKIEFRATLVAKGWSSDHELLNEAGAVIALSVTDTGIGIAPEQQQAIFEPFAQGDGTTSRKFGGTGLGLSICRELTRLLGGEVKVVSAPSQGSTFTVYLPATTAIRAGRRPSSAPSNGSSAPSNAGAPAQTRSTWRRGVRTPTKAARPPQLVRQGARAALAPVQPEPHSVDEAETSLVGKKVLVVDDDIRNIFALTAMLERHQMIVASVDSGREAIETLRRTRDIDVALVDVMMPEVDGYATMAWMRELDTFKDRPIIALTAKAMKGDREKCIEAGASDYIAKPVDGPQLLRMLRAWLAG
jgi:signal transduction histidine kinase/HAMP domain-containing protein